MTRVTSSSGRLVVVDAALFPVWFMDAKKLHKRIEKAVRKSGAGEFVHTHVQAVAVAVPPGEHEVVADGRDIVVRVPEGDISAQAVGDVPVDAARLLIGDPDVMSSWQDETATDGLADVVLWGRDVEEAAALLEARVEERAVHWRNLEPDEAEARARELSARCEREGLMVVVAATPHSHYWLVCERSDGAEDGLAEVELEGGVVCGIATESDGYFAVETGRDEIRIRSARPEQP